MPRYEQLKVRRLVRKAKHSKASKSRRFKPTLSVKTEPGRQETASTAGEAEEGSWKLYLSRETIDSIYELSHGLPNYALALMMHLFDNSELVEARNVYGRRGNSVGRLERSLDRRRLEIIRQLLEEKGTVDEGLWKRCVRTMNLGIYRARDRVKQRLQ